LTPGSRRNGTRKLGHTGKAAGRHAGNHAGWQGTAPRKPARWAGKAVPAAAIAATLAAGAAAYGLTGGSAHASPGNLMNALSVPIEQGTVTHGGAGKAEAFAATKTAPSPASSPALARIAPAGSSSAQSTQSAATASSQPSQAQSAAAQPATAAASPAPSATASSGATAGTVSCADNSYLLPANVTTIVNFLLANGYSDNAVAGMAGNIYQESKGDPESIGMGGGGLIGFTPLPSGYVTGNPTADLQTQLSAILTYNQGWSAYIPALNDAPNPAYAADIYVTDFERAGIPMASTREASAEAVAAACNI
jgi:Phage tail lysozyme